MNALPTTRPKWSTTTKIVVVLLILLAGGLIARKFGAAIYPIILALILAFILAPLVTLLQRKLKMNRVLAIILVYLVLFISFGAILWIIIPILFNQIQVFVKDIDIWIGQALNFFAQDFQIGSYIISGDILLEPITNALQNILEPAVGSTIGIVALLIESIAWIVFIIIISIYLIKESNSILAWFEHLVPPYGRLDYNHILREINIIWSAFFRGQLLLALVVSVIITIEGLILGLPFALLMGVFAGLLEFLPSIGHGIWLVVASLLALILGSTWLPLPNWVFFLLILSVHIIFTQFDLNYLIPKIIGRSVHLPPLVVILGIIAGASLAGVLGVVLAAPTIASLRVLGGYVYARLFDQDPFPDRVTTVPPLPPPELRWWQQRAGKKPRIRKKTSK
jgi:predicted PurR-regulated permease PerM